MVSRPSEQPATLALASDPGVVLEGLFVPASDAAALAFAGDCATGPIAACGYSFGSAVAVRTAATSPRVRRLLLVSPPASMLDVETLHTFAGDILVAVGELDEWTSPPELEKIAAGLERAQLCVIPAADHFFMSGLRELGRGAAGWLGAPA